MEKDRVERLQETKKLQNMMIQSLIAFQKQCWYKSSSFRIGAYRKVVEMDFPFLLFLLSCSAADAEDAFIHAEHDGSARHRPHQVRSHSAVETGEAFFYPDAAEALDQACVFRLAVGHRGLS